MFLYLQDPAANSTLPVLGYKVNVTGNVNIPFFLYFRLRFFARPDKAATYVDRKSLHITYNHIARRVSIFPYNR